MLDTKEASQVICKKRRKPCKCDVDNPYISYFQVPGNDYVVAYRESPYNQWLVKGRVFSNKVFFRKICWDCYFKHIRNEIDVAKRSMKSKWYRRILKGENAIPIACTSPNKSFLWLFDLTEDELNHERQKFDTASKESFIRRHGPIEGEKLYAKYVKRQAYTCSKEYMMNEKGMTEEEWHEFNQSRASTKKNFIARYGKEEGLRRWDEYCELEKYAGCSLQYFIDKYGPELGPQKLCEVNASKALTLDNFIKKYGVEEGKKRFEEIASKPFSNISQEMFKAIDQKLSAELSCQSQYETKNGEAVVSVLTENTVRAYRPDYVLGMKVIEFNGDYWHANPEIYDATDIVNSRVASEIWETDKERLNHISSLGYDIKVVWENDYKNNSTQIIDECVNFLMNEQGNELSCPTLK